MRNIIVFNMITADGYFEGPNHEIDWHNVDAEFNDFAIAQLHEAGTLLFGRRTYDLMAQYWSTEMAKHDDPVVAGLMNEMDKIVFSHTLSTADWHNTTLITDDTIDRLKKYKEDDGKALLVLGSSNLSVSLLDAGLIDEVRFIVNPVVLGNGHPIFAGLSKSLRLRLLENRTFNSGNVLLRYNIEA